MIKPQIIEFLLTCAECEEVLGLSSLLRLVDSEAEKHTATTGHDTYKTIAYQRYSTTTKNYEEAYKNEKCN